MLPFIEDYKNNLEEFFGQFNPFDMINSGEIDKFVDILNYLIDNIQAINNDHDGYHSIIARWLGIPPGISGLFVPHSDTRWIMICERCRHLNLMLDASS